MIPAKIYTGTPGTSAAMETRVALVPPNLWCFTMKLRLGSEGVHFFFSRILRPEIVAIHWPNLSRKEMGKVWLDDEIHKQFKLNTSDLETHWKTRHFRNQNTKPKPPFRENRFGACYNGDTLRCKSKIKQQFALEPHGGFYFSESRILVARSSIEHLST